MANIWIDNEKWIVALGIGIAGYHGLSMTFNNLAIPMLSRPLFGGISLLTIGSGLAIYGGIILLTKY